MPICCKCFEHEQFRISYLSIWQYWTSLPLPWQCIHCPRLYFELQYCMENIFQDFNLLIPVKVMVLYASKLQQYDDHLISFLKGWTWRVSIPWLGFQFPDSCFSRFWFQSGLPILFKLSRFPHSLTPRCGSLTPALLPSILGPKIYPYPCTIFTVDFWSLLIIVQMKFSIPDICIVTSARPAR